MRCSLTSDHHFRILTHQQMGARQQFSLKKSLPAHFGDGLQRKKVDEKSEMGSEHIHLESTPCCAGRYVLMYHVCPCCEAV